MSGAILQDIRMFGSMARVIIGEGLEIFILEI